MPKPGGFAGIFCEWLHWQQVWCQSQVSVSAHALVTRATEQENQLSQAFILSHSTFITSAAAWELHEESRGRICAQCAASWGPKKPLGCLWTALKLPCSGSNAAAVPDRSFGITPKCFFFLLSCGEKDGQGQCHPAREGFHQFSASPFQLLCTSLSDAIGPQISTAEMETCLIIDYEKDMVKNSSLDGGF